jgi:hypothetical protein
MTPVLILLVMKLPRPVVEGTDAVSLVGGEQVHQPV